MICKGCNEPIEVGEAVVPEAINGSKHYHYYHPECFHKEEERLEEATELARTVH